MNAFRVWVICTLALVICCGSTVLFPYWLKDDLWIARAAVDAEFTYLINAAVAATQGRPLFAFFLLRTAELAAALGLTAFALIRAAAIGLLALLLTQIWRWLVDWGWAPRAAIATALLIGTLPASTIIVAGGPWLVIPLVLTAAAAAQIHGVAEAGLPVRTSLRRLLGPAMLLWASFAFYQSTPQLLPALLIVPALAMLADGRVRNTIALHTIVFGMATFMVALIVYYIGWRTSYSLLASSASSGDGRYAPGAVSMQVANVIERLWLMLSVRLPAVLDLWHLGASVVSSVNVEEYLRDARRVDLSALSLLTPLAIVAGLASALLQQKHLQRGVSALLLIAGMLVFADLSTLASPKPLLSYTSMFGLSAAVGMLLCWSLIQCIARLRLPGYAGAGMLGALAVVGVAVAAQTVWRYFPVPLTAEHQLVMLAVRDHAAATATDCGIELISRRSPMAPAGRWEFGWSNLDNPFYAQQFVRMARDELGLPSVPVEVRDAVSGVLLRDRREYEPPADPARCRSEPVDLGAASR